MPQKPIFSPRDRTTILMPSRIGDALAQAARDEHMSKNSLLTRIAEEWLETKGYLHEKATAEA